jgi:hypothetical protein
MSNNRFLFVMCCLLWISSATAQRSDCGTKPGAKPLYVDISIEQNSVQATYPLLMKVFVHVIANDDGTLRAVEDTSMLRQLENMRQFYAAHNICFILAGIEQINSTDLNTHDADSEESELSAFLVPDVLNIFVHRTLFDNDGSLNGIAYNIPNYYLSLVASAVESADNRSTTAHEMGHCFGLYHTFERHFGTENIPRSGDCRNCTVAGDLLCDTRADPHSDTYDTGTRIDANCNFTGTLTQACDGTNITFNMDPHNVMAYGRRACRDVFTSGQGARARSVIETEAMLQSCISPENANVSTNQNITSGRRFYVARNSITIDPASFVVSNTARVNISSNIEIVLKPGVTLSPTGTNGYTSVAISSLCQ